jgi:NADH:ubiquinone oxidoreductase subunit 6 (subunit J)
LNKTALIALVQLIAFAAGVVVARRQTEAIAATVSRERTRAYAALALGCLLVIGATVAWASANWPYLSIAQVVVAIGSLLYLPLSTANSDEEDDSPVPFGTWVKMSFALGLGFASLGALFVRLL